MHNAFDGISGDFRPANVNRRKKRNRHPAPALLSEIPVTPSPFLSLPLFPPFPESIDSEAKQRWRRVKNRGTWPPRGPPLRFVPSKLFKPLPTLFYLPFTAPLRPLSARLRIPFSDLNSSHHRRSASRWPRWATSAFVSRFYGRPRVPLDGRLRNFSRGIGIPFPRGRESSPVTIRRRCV